MFYLALSGANLHVEVFVLFVEIFGGLFGFTFLFQSQALFLYKLWVKTFID
jgi:hypothetical protein